MSDKIWAIVPAGGVGTRMGSSLAKQYLMLGDKPVIWHTLTRLAEIKRVDNIVLGIADNDAQWPLLGFSHSKLKVIVRAGQQRVETVQNCLVNIMELGGENDWVLVHDAVRPCVRVSEILTLLDRVISSGAQGGILAAPLTDTIKRSHCEQVADTNAHIITKTIPREQLWRAMTPQLFKVGSLLEAIVAARRKGQDVSDESSAMEGLGYAPLLVPCSADNIKITLPGDVEFAKMILYGQRQETNP